MSKTSKIIIATASTIVLFAVIVVFAILNTHSYDIPLGTVGNTAGNLYNKGLFCEAGGKVFFSNSFDNNALYVMNPDQSGMKRLGNLQARYINAGGDYLFFNGEMIPEAKGLGVVAAKPGLFMCSKNGGKMTAFTKDAVQSLVLVDNKLYFQHYKKETGSSLNEITIPKKNSEVIYDHLIDPSCVYGNLIIYAETSGNHYLKSYNTITGETSVIWGGNVWNPIFDGTYVYFMNVDNDYQLCRYSITNNQMEILTKDRVDFFNLYNGVIFYQKSSQKSPALKRMGLDGSNVEIIAEGTFNSINCTSTYTYFKAFGDDSTTYMTSTFGSPSVQTFSAAQTAAFSNMK